MTTPQYDRGRIPVPLEERALSSGMASQASRIAGILNNGWTTEEKYAEACGLLLAVARDALNLQARISLALRQREDEPRG